MSSEEPIEKEYLLKSIEDMLPDPVAHENQLDGDVVMVGGDPGEVIVRISGNKVSVALYTVRWETPYTPVVRPKPLAALNWRSLPGSTTMTTLHELVSAAVQMRRADFQKCSRCGETKPSESMHEDQVCQACAQRYLGVTY